MRATIDSRPSIDLLAIAMRPETTTYISPGSSPSLKITSPRRNSRSLAPASTASRSVSSSPPKRAVFWKRVVSGISGGHASYVQQHPPALPDYESLRPSGTGRVL